MLFVFCRGSRMVRARSPPPKGHRFAWAKRTYLLLLAALAKCSQNWSMTRNRPEVPKFWSCLQGSRVWWGGRPVLRAGAEFSKSSRDHDWGPPNPWICSSCVFVKSCSTELCLQCAGMWCDTPAVNLNHRGTGGSTVHSINTEICATVASLS